MGRGGPFSTIVVLNLSLMKLGQIAGSELKINVGSLDVDETISIEDLSKETSVYLWLFSN